MKSFRAAVVALIALTVVGIVIKMFLPEKQPRKISQFTEGTDAESIELCLKWYAQNALGALRPAEAGLLILPSGPPDDAWVPSKNKSEVESLAKAGVLEYKPVLRASGYQWYVTLSPQYRTHVWWPGKPYEEQIFFYSPLLYDIVSVERVGELGGPDVAKLQVDFTWKAKSFSPFYEKALSMDLIPFSGTDSSHSKGDWQTMIGKNVKHTVVMEHGEYGYFLPISREPQPPKIEATQGEVIYSPKESDDETLSPQSQSDFDQS